MNTLPKRYRNLSRSWHESEDIAYVKVSSDCTPGIIWRERIRSQGFRLGCWAEDMLLSPDFIATHDMKHEVAIIRGNHFSDANRLTKIIREYATSLGLIKAFAEVACLVREKFSDRDISAMGFSRIAFVHPLIRDSDGEPRMFVAGTTGEGRWLKSCIATPATAWGKDTGFAFVVPPW